MKGRGIDSPTGERPKDSGQHELWLTSTFKTAIPWDYLTCDFWRDAADAIVGVVKDSNIASAGRNITYRLHRLRSEQRSGEMTFVVRADLPRNLIPDIRRASSPNRHSVRCLCEDEEDQIDESLVQED